jgi:hypothetical protein
LEPRCHFGDLDAHLFHHERVERSVVCSRHRRKQAERRIAAGGELGEPRILPLPGSFPRRRSGAVLPAGFEARAGCALALMPSAIASANSLAARQAVGMAARRRQSCDEITVVRVTTSMTFRMFRHVYQDPEKRACGGREL